MGKFSFASAPPPLKTERVKVEEWDPEEEFIIKELDAAEAQEMVSIARKVIESNNLQGNVELYAEILSRCLTTSDGEKAPKEWLMKSGITTLKRLGIIAMTLNGLTAEARAELEKN